MAQLPPAEGMRPIRPTMRLLTFSRPGDHVPALGVRVGSRVLDVVRRRAVDLVGMPAGLKALLAAGSNAMARVRELIALAQAHDGDRFDAAWADESAIR